MRRQVALLLVFVAPVLAACETTQEKSARLEAQGTELAKEGKIELSRTNQSIEILDRYVLTDQYGSAVVLKVRNKSGQGQIDVPIQIDVKDAKGKSVYRNDQEGLEDGLINLQIVEPSQTTWWVNDQVLASGKPAKVEAQVGESEVRYPAKVPEIEVSKPTIEVDPTSGVNVSGTAVNKSAIEQVDMLLYAVAVKGGKVVAAGRGLIPKLKTDGKKAPYNIFFIGDPKGAQIEVFATPNTFE